MRAQRITIDASKFVNKKAAHAEMRRAIGRAEDYAGDNLDALHDVLTTHFTDCRITVKNFDAAYEALEDYAKGIKKVFEDSAEENAHILSVKFK